ncbi:HxlR family transcriptional regulator [Escherichia coli]|jgi:transcriptional regulator, hxlR family|nr:HxlR family transcriptional regulator [Escherichia coli]OJR09615.1 transcriptional regulator [Escherichia coli]
MGSLHRFVLCLNTLTPKLTFSKYVQKGKYEMSQVSLSQQLKEGNLFAEQCPSREVLKHVTSRWGILILVALREGTHRFSDLRRKIGGVSEKMLAQSLQALEQDGFLNRIAYPVVPPHVEYSLTPLGEQVSEKVAALADWIELNLPEVLAVRDERAA